ncbi:proepiregulin-like [Kryptolebias marmoratus]|uniref:Proepiregulin-like n=1 Tax=Kryptolebias marmoratus TaxID=37003 RepID=A0A3Q2ZUB0_KRYMA|nr:proepiregulin-like [Kryptolebias marmoratus]
MGNSKISALFSMIGVMLIWPHVFTKSISPTLQTTENSTLSPGQGEEKLERPLVENRSITSCGSNFNSYCMNNGICMLLVELNEHHCKCKEGFHGPRCNSPKLSTGYPLQEEQIVTIIICVILLIIGLAGALYFCCRYKKNKFSPQQKQTGYRGVQES